MVEDHNNDATCSRLVTRPIRLLFLFGLMAWEFFPDRIRLATSTRSKFQVDSVPKLSNASVLILSPNKSSARFDTTETNYRGTKNDSFALRSGNYWDLQLPPFDFVAASERRKSSQELLQRMEETGVFETPFSSNETFRKGFLRTWEPCVLERVLQRQKMLLGRNASKNPRINVVVVGGSASARPASHCTLPDKAYGRYSDYLEWNLQQDNLNLTKFVQDGRDEVESHGFPSFRVYNMAQGTCCSTTNALLMDNLIDPSTTDLIIWEFLINDHHGSLKEQTRKLDFWLRRVKSHFETASQPPPAILLNYLWTFAAHGIAQKGKSINEKPMSYSGNLIDTYRSMGWDIAAVHVGASVDDSRLKTKTRALFDDMHHPACTGVKYIASLLQYTIYSNLASHCSIDNFSKEWRPHNTTQSIIPPPETLLGNNIKGRKWESLWKDLFHKDAIVASLSAFEPRQDGISRIGLSKSMVSNLTRKYIDGLKGKAATDRADRKYQFNLPCNMTLDLQEPNLRWIGIGRKWGGMHVVINGLKLPYQEANCDWVPGQVYTCFWINLAEAQIPKSDVYRISSCEYAKESRVKLHHVISVSIPSGG